MKDLSAISVIESTVARLSELNEDYREQVSELYKRADELNEREKINDIQIKELKEAVETLRNKE